MRKDGGEDVKRKKQTKVDPEIMAELLDEPGVKENVERMTAGELELFKKLLVSQGIYSQYVKERGK